MINYYLLTKPGIILGNLITFAAGFLLASEGTVDFRLFFSTLLGLGFVIASACVFNNYIDRRIDRKMQRTKNRPLAKGLIAGSRAIIFGSLLGIGGALILVLTANLLAVVVAAVGFFVYVVLYSLWKSRTIYGTAIGSIAGAVPPVVGYCAVSGRFDLGALLLFALLVMWQMPHFYAIAVYHLDDYASAGIPALPIVKGYLRTKIHMILYILGFILSAVLLSAYHYAGNVFLAVSCVTGLIWLGICLQGFIIQDHQLWGKRMFQWSLVLIAAVCLVVPFDK